MPAEIDVVVVVPIRSFQHGKARLAGALSDTERSALARKLAGRVLDAADGLHVVVVSSDEEVRAFAVERGVAVLDDPGSLDAAAAAGRDYAASTGARRAIIVHADIAHPTPFGWVADFDGVTIVPDRHGEGTNVLCVPSDAPFEFAYGDGSRARHEAAAARVGLPLRVVGDEALGWDVDEPDDLIEV